MNIETKQLIITGGSKGIGKAAIALFQQQEWQVLNLSRSACDIDGVENLAIDLSDPAAITRHQKQLQTTFNQADQCCLIHNAGDMMRDRVGDQKIDILQTNFQLMIIAATALNNLLIKRMTTGSSILYIGSTVSEMGVPDNASYITLKHAVVGMMRATCQDLADTGIHTCCVCPGLTDTDMLRDSLATAKAIEWAKSKVGANRLIHPNEIAELLFFCANHAVINGSVLHAHLGQLQQ
ncbi:MAG: SDR family NAD(P)-dependent oxidoreductase [Coxiellaceae bacterium]|nr:SDR family NAD(P)-dependent oxidoreductase [Coxiellaceae bacterium]